jgi:N-acetylmuramic acid 6-phosphate etherase
MTDAALIAQLKELVSEASNPRSAEIDLMSTLEILQTINAEDREVPKAVEAVLPAIAAAVDLVTQAFGRGGRLVYMGAGTSGRLGVLDASECPPTFSVPKDMVIGLIAGGPTALTAAIEGAEDDEEGGRQALAELDLTAKDVVVGIAVSGRTPYVIGGLRYARSLGAATISLSCNPGSTIAALADVAISPVVGPEVLTGSTRLKSGTAQKLVLNMLSTASMIRIGKTYGNLMVDLTVSNAKLSARATAMLMEATGCGAAEAQRLLETTEGSVKLAILMQLTGTDVSAARAALERSNGFLRPAIRDRE